MSLNLDGRENKIGFISDTMTGFYSLMRSLQRDYRTYSGNFSEEALALLSRSDDFIESVEAVRSLDSLSRIDDEGINELFLLSQQIAELYHLKKNGSRNLKESKIDLLEEKLTKAIKSYANIVQKIKSGIAGSSLKKALNFVGWGCAVILLIQVGYFLGTTNLNNIIPLSTLFQYDVLTAIAQTCVGTPICDVLLKINAAIRYICINTWDTLRNFSLRF